MSFVFAQKDDLYGSWMIPNAPGPMLMTFAQNGENKSEHLGLFEEPLFIAKLTADSLVLDQNPGADYVMGGWTSRQVRFLRFSYLVMQDTLLLSSDKSTIRLLRFTDEQRRSKETFNLRFANALVEPELPSLQQCPTSLDTSKLEPALLYTIGPPKKEHRREYGREVILSSYEEVINLTDLPTDLYYSSSSEVNGQKVTIGLFVNGVTPISFLQSVLAILKDRQTFFAVNTADNATEVHVTWVKLDGLEKVQGKVLLGDYINSLR